MFDEMVCNYDATTGAGSQYNQSACGSAPATEAVGGTICYTTCTGNLVNSVTVTQELDGNTANTSCFVGGVGICEFDARLGGASTTTAGPLDCSRVSVSEGMCLEDYVVA